MNVLMTADAVGGVWTFALELVDALAGDDVRVTLAVMGPPPDAVQRDDVAASAAAGWHHRPFALEWMPDPWGDVAAAGGWLQELERALTPDLIHVNGYAHAALPWGAPVVVTAHSDVLSWWEAVKGEPAPATWNRYRRGVEEGLAAADAVVAPTAAYREALVREVPVPHPIHVVRNGRRPDPFRAREKEPLVLTAGRRWDEAKNIGAVERVAAALAWQVVVVGAQEDRSDPSGGSVASIVPWQTPAALAAWLGRASIFALPARYEPFGYGPLEAALSGCALVLGDIESLRELWDAAAVFVDPADDRAVERGIRSLIDDPELRTRLAERARERAGFLTPAAMASGYLEIYRRVTSTTAVGERV